MLLIMLFKNSQPVTTWDISPELILSILAILISICAIFFEYFWNQKINKTNLEADFFRNIYGDFLMNKISKARNIIHYNNQKISDTQDLIDVLNDIRHSSLFYKYKDKSFYNLLCERLRTLEDKLVSKTDKILDNDDYSDFIQETNSDIETIYNIIMNKYIGKK